MNTSMPLGFLCLVIAGLLSTPASAAVSRAEYDALIRAARAGNYEPALIMLRQHGVEHPMDLRAAYDHILIATWAGNNDEAIAAYEAIQPAPNHPPADVLIALARAYRDTQRWDYALDHYREGRRLFPRQSSFAVGEIMTLADAGRADEAIALGKELIDEIPDDADARLALSYAYKVRPSPYPVLQEADHARTLAPRKTYVTREYIDALQHAGLAQAALTVAREHPDLLNDAKMRQLEADYLAEVTRLAAMPYRLESERFATADRALADYERLIPAWEALGPAASADVTRLRADRLQALHARSRMQDVVDGYESLVADGISVPRYVLNDVASAYLYLRRPEEAQDLYRQVMGDGSQRDNPSERLSNETGLYYSLIESEQFDEAGNVIQAARAGQPTWRYIKGVPQRVPNDLHLYSEQTAALGLFYTDDTAGAQARLKDLVDRAPTNVGLRTSLANVYASRGWPRRAEKQLKVAEALEPQAVEVKAVQGLTALKLQEWRQAEILTQDLATRFPEELATQNLQREWALHNKAELRVEARRGIASDSPVTGSGDFGIETVLYSAPLNHNWRVFGGAGYANGDFDEGSGNYRWLRTGAEWRGRDMTAEMEASTHNYGYGTKPGARMSVAYDLSDQWQVGASAELRSRDTPLRALRNDISSNAAGVYARWRQSDHREWRFSLAPSHFSDGNNRLAATLSGRERIYTRPHLKADLNINIAATRNSQEGGPYFNPRSDLEVLPTLNLTHTLYRRYETVWEQTFILGIGAYKQQDFGTGAIAVAGYGMRYRYNNAFDIGATVLGISRPYDGIREREVRFMLDMSFRF
ncbi:poly-beta-1,6 N-acetyl-D-glucosamine export porin PgaA [Pollutimonas sp. H1-120]|uniref:poly-beta-1,6 N-acetyl-D-glucosamine export porin PgaA n=1 Tax=Pollutimonas sp. H1-120 TaxID=3148824 RepID=UPI003B5237B0